MTIEQSNAWFTRICVFLGALFILIAVMFLAGCQKPKEMSVYSLHVPSDPAAHAPCVDVHDPNPQHQIPCDTTAVEGTIGIRCGDGNTWWDARADGICYDADNPDKYPRIQINPGKGKWLIFDNTFVPNKAFDHPMNNDGGGSPAYYFESHEAKVYAELWRVAKEKKLKYQVHCYRGLGCGAEAWPASADNFVDVDHWRAWNSTEGDSTAAAEQLLQVLKGQPNLQACCKSLPSYKEKNPVTFDTGEIRP